MEWSNTPAQVSVQIILNKDTIVKYREMIPE